MLQELAALWKKKAGVDSPDYLSCLGLLGQILVQEKQWTEAESMLRECLTISERRFPNEWGTFVTKSFLGVALLGQKKYPEAEPLLRSGYEGLKRQADKIPPQGKGRLEEALDRLIELAEATGKSDDAKMWTDEKAKLPPPPPLETKKP